MAISFRRSISSLLFATVLLSGGNARSLAGNARDAAAAAELYKQANQWLHRSYTYAPKALPLIKQALKLDPDKAEYLALKAQILYEFEEGDAEALAAIERACALSPKDATYLGLKSHLLMRMKQPKLALQAVKEAIRLSLPDRVDLNVVTFEASILSSQGDLPGAEEALSWAIKLGPSFVDPRIARAKVRMARKNYKGAIEDSTFALNHINPNAMDPKRKAGLMLARAYELSNNQTQAKIEYLHLVNEWPDRADVIAESLRYFQSIGDGENVKKLKQRMKEFDDAFVPF